MKRLINGLILLTLITVYSLSQNDGFSQNVAVLDAKYGFKDAKFETPITYFKNMVKQGPGIYTRSTENLRLGEFDLESVFYNFYKGLLSSIVIETEGYRNGQGVLQILQAAYGNGRYEDETYYWMGNRVVMTYSEGPASGHVAIGIFSIKMMQMQDDDEKEAAKKAASEL